MIGVEPELIGNIASLILAANCRFKLKTDNYKRLACKVFDRYNQLLPGYHMPPGLHILLVHVPQLQDILDYPVSRTSEECIEALQKVVREAIRHHTLLTSAESINLSLLRYLFVISDPVIASLLHYDKMSHEDIPAPALDLVHVDDDEHEISADEGDELLSAVLCALSRADSQISQ